MNNTTDIRDHEDADRGTTINFLFTEVDGVDGSVDWAMTITPWSLGAETAWVASDSVDAEATFPTLEAAEDQCIEWAEHAGLLADGADLATPLYAADWDRVRAAQVRSRR